MMFKQMGEFRKPPYNYKDSGMLLTLKYCYETLGMTVNKDAGLGIIPYYYERAKKHYLKRRSVNKANENREYNSKTIKVKITPSRNHKKIKLIKLEDVEHVEEFDE